MRKQLQYFGGSILIAILVLAIGGCSTITEKLGKKNPSTKPKPREQVETKPEKTSPPKPDVQNIIQEGTAYRAQGDFKKAIASFEQALKLEPKNTFASTQLQETKDEMGSAIDTHIKQGIKYFTQENLQAAMREWNWVLNVDPANKDALDYKARTQKQLDALENK
jgi:Tfp pilus assembly protein PilF